MHEFDFRNLYYSNKELRDCFLNTINKELLLVDFTKRKKHYKIDFNNDLKLQGVYSKVLNDWEWSWMNTLNNNYSSLFLITKEIYNLEKKQLNLNDFSSKSLNETLKFLSDSIKKYKQHLFCDGDIFKEMFFMTQKTWNHGIISTISTIVSLGKKYPTSNVKISFKRGLKEDMSGGCDFKIKMNGELKKVQHKSTSIFEGEKFYRSKGFIYNENTYRNNIDVLSIEYKDKVYIFNNSKYVCDCYMGNDGYFYIKKTELIEIMDKEFSKTSELLQNINKLCFNKKIIFEFQNDGGTENYFEDKLNEKPKSLRLFINDYENENLNKILETKIEELNNIDE